MAMTLDDAIMQQYMDATYPMPEELPPGDMTQMATEMAAGTEPEGTTPMSLRQFAETAADAPAGILKGTAQQFFGTAGDIELLGRAVDAAVPSLKPGQVTLFPVVNAVRQLAGMPENALERFVEGLESNTIMPTTEDIKKWFDTNIGTLVPPGASKQRIEAAKTAEFTGEVAGFGGALKATADVASEAARGARQIGREILTEAPVGAIQLAQSRPMPNVVSTRLPTAKKATEDPMTGELQSDFATMTRDPAAFQKNMDIVRTYPNFASKARSPEAAAESFINEVKNNLLFLHDAVPQATRERSKLWYDGARKIVDQWGQEFNQPDQALSGVLAVLSPQKDWFMNVSLGNRVIDIALNKSDYVWDKDMTSVASQIWAAKYKPVINLVKGKAYAELQTPAQKALWLRTYDQTFNPRDHRIVTPEGDFGDVRLTKKGQPSKVAWGSLNEIGKAISILDNPSLENINKMLGTQHKVRNFYNNIYAPGDPRGHVTIDTHAVAAGLLRPLSGKSREVLHNFGSGVKGQGGVANSSVTGSQGTYGLYAEAYKRAAEERGILPREMQSITWEAVRGLFPETFKNAKNTQQIDDIWLQYKKGKISLEEVRNAVVESAGGINPPEWESAGGGLRSGIAPAGGDATNARELPGVGVPGGSAGGSGRVQPAATNPTVKRGQASARGAK